MLQDFIINTVSAIISAAFIAFIAYVFRNKIKYAFLGDSLQPADAIPQIELLNETPCADPNRINYYLLTIRNTGNIQVYRPQLFLCQLDPRSLSIRPLSSRTNLKWSNKNEGEMLQLEISASELYGFGRDDRWLYLQMLNERGVVYRKTFYLDDNKTLIPQAINRVNKPLPNKTLFAFTEARAQKLIVKYDLNLTVG